MVKMAQNTKRVEANALALEVLDIIYYILLIGVKSMIIN